MALISGCTDSGTADQTPAPPEAGSSTEQEIDVSNAFPQSLTMEQAVDAAKNDMARRLDADVDGIEVVTARAVTWGDGSLGCPEPGMMYTQALVPGFYIRLRHDSDDAYYHAGRDGQPMHCPADRSLPPVDGKGPNSPQS